MAHPWHRLYYFYYLYTSLSWRPFCCSHVNNVSAWILTASAKKITMGVTLRSTSSLTGPRSYNQWCTNRKMADYLIPGLILHACLMHLSCCRCFQILRFWTMIECRPFAIRSDLLVAVSIWQLLQYILRGIWGSCWRYQQSACISSLNSTKNIWGLNFRRETDIEDCFGENCHKGPTYQDSQTAHASNLCMQGRNEVDWTEYQEIRSTNIPRESENVRSSSKPCTVPAACKASTVMIL